MQLKRAGVTTGVSGELVQKAAAQQVGARAFNCAGGRQAAQAPCSPPAHSPALPRPPRPQSAMSQDAAALMATQVQAGSPVSTQLPV